MNASYFTRRLFLWPVFLMTFFSAILLHNLFPSVKLYWYQAFSLFFALFVSFSLFSAILMRQVDFVEVKNNSGVALRGILRRMLFWGPLFYAPLPCLMGARVIPEKLGLELFALLQALLAAALLAPAHLFLVQRGKKRVLRRVRATLDITHKKIYGVAYSSPKAHSVGDGKLWVNIVALALFLGGIFSIVLPKNDIDPTWAACAALFAPLALGAALSWAAVHWNAIIQGAAAILPSIFFIFILCAACVIGLLSPQGQDALRVLGSGAIDTIFFFLLLVIFVVVSNVSFYSSLFVADLKSKVVDRQSLSLVMKTEIILPNLITVYTVLLILYAAIKANKPASNPLMPWWTISISLFSVFSLLSIALMGKRGSFLFRLWAAFPKLFFNKTHNRIKRNRLRDAPRAMNFLIVTALLWAVFLILMTVDNGEICVFLHTPFLLIFAVILWIGISGILQMVSNTTKTGMVFVHVLLFFFLFFSPWRNNHGIREIPSAKKQRCDVAALFGSYQSTRDPKNSNRPLIVVAEGGGMRSAYWTAMLLAGIQERYPGFYNRLFALSSVSGGSFGSNAFVALMKSRPTKPCTPLVDSVMRHDFLSPVLGKLLFPEVVQRFLPVNLSPFDTMADRARALEKSWESALGGGNAAGPLLSKGFLENNGGALPGLFLNTTWSETGERGVIGSSRLCAPSVALDILDTIGPSLDVPWSTAISLSARFPVISPGGQISDVGGPCGHCIDGGYHDNTGIQTALEIIDGLPPKTRPIIILVRNQNLDTTTQKPLCWYNEISEIISGYMKVSSARAGSDVKMLKKRFAEKSVFDFNMPLSQDEVPLGWYLSPAARDRVKKYVGSALDDPSPASSIRALLAELNK